MGSMMAADGDVRNGTLSSGFQELGISAEVVSDITDIQGKSVTRYA